MTAAELLVEQSALLAKAERLLRAVPLAPQWCPARDRWVWDYKLLTDKAERDG